MTIALQSDLKPWGQAASDGATANDALVLTAMDDGALVPPTLLADRALVRVAGDDPRGFLQGLLTNDVAGALPVAAALLSPQGKVIVDMIVWADPDGGDAILLDVEASAGDDLVKRLSRY